MEKLFKLLSGESHGGVPFSQVNEVIRKKAVGIVGDKKRLKTKSQESFQPWQIH